jgi:hypothetical protein
VPADAVIAKPGIQSNTTEHGKLALVEKNSASDDNSTPESGGRLKFETPDSPEKVNSGAFNEYSSNEQLEHIKC